MHYATFLKEWQAVQQKWNKKNPGYILKPALESNWNWDS